MPRKLITRRWLLAAALWLAFLVPASAQFGPPVGQVSYPAVAPVVTVLTTASMSPWTVPANWNSANNTIEVVGDGGGGGTGSGFDPAAGGGGGGFGSRSRRQRSAGSDHHHVQAMSEAAKAVIQFTRRERSGRRSLRRWRRPGTVALPYTADALGLWHRGGTAGGTPPGTIATMTLVNSSGSTAPANTVPTQTFGHVFTGTRMPETVRAKPARANGTSWAGLSSPR
jgi:hypothetical protein